MFDVTDDLEAILRNPSNRTRDLVCVYEFYEWDYAPAGGSFSGLSYDPREALELFSGQSVSFTWGAETITYRREVINGPSINKSIGKKFDSVSIQFSNVSRYLATFVLNNRVQGMRLVVRVIPRSANDLSIVEGSASPFTHSIIWFVGRCDKPDGFTRSSGTISAKQDLGTIEATIPERDFQPGCPLKFKKGDCLGNETLDQKTATYQAAKVCNKTEEQCIQYGNEEYFQGTQILQLTSSFIHKHNEGFFKKILNILPGISRKKTVVPNSVHDGTPYGQPVPVILGRWAKSLIPIQYQDLGNTINFKMAACRGLIKDFLNIRNVAPNFSQPSSISEHLGDYGDVGTQTQDLLFPGGEFHSKLAYITGSCTGSDIIVEDPAPDITALIAGQIVRAAFGLQAGQMLGMGRLDNVFAGYDGGEDVWSDNPVDLAHFIITDPAYLNLATTQIGQQATARTSAYSTGAIKDVSNAERCLLPDTQTGIAGTDYKRYNSTGMIGPLNFFGVGGEFLFQVQRPGGYWNREAEYEFFDPDSPPESLTVKTFYRKRYTANIEINEKKKAIDFLYDTLLASFRGFLRWDEHGRLVIDCERPVDNTELREDAAASATSIKVKDVTPWKRLEGALDGLSELRGKILIGAHKLTSEVRPVTSSEYSADGNGITFSTSETSASFTISPASGTLSGGSSSVAASALITLGGTVAVDDEISITIDGYTVTIIATQEDVDASIDTLTIACQLVYAINAEPVLNEYIEAWKLSNTEIGIYCKFGVLNFVTALEEDHFAELDDPTTAPTLASSAGALSAGAYLVAYAYRNANGNTNISNIGTITITANKQIDVTGVALPAGADSIDWFVSVEANSDVMLLVNNNNGAGFSINALPAVTEDQVPERNTTGEEIMRVMYSDAQKALTYADTTRATHLDGSFGWPEGGRQSTVNQVKGTYREAIQDFAQQPITINDERHQEDTGQINSATLDLSAVDNFNQASRLLNGYLAKFRDLDFFFKWSAGGEALLLEIGDVVCLSDSSGSWRNVPVRIEEIGYNQNFEASFTCRLYSTSAFDDSVLQTQVPLPSDLPNYLGAPPDIIFNTVDFPPDGLVQSTDGSAGITSIRGGAIVGDFIYGQYVNVRVIKRAGVTVNETVLSHATPDSNGEVVFELPASADGLYTVELEVCSVLNVCNTTKPTASIVIGFGSLFGMAKEGGVLMLKEGTVIMEKEHG